MKEIAQAVIDALKTQPGLLAVMVINVLILVTFVYLNRSLASEMERDNALIIELVKKCSAP